MAKLKVINNYFQLILFFISCELSFCDLTTTKKSPQPLWNATYTDKLRQNLLLNYDKFSRPAEPSQKITISLGMTLRHIEVNEIKSTMTVHCLIKLTWKDQKMQWNASDYGGVKILHLADHEVWQPDIFLYNGVTSTPLSVYSSTQLFAYPNGKIIWVPPAQLTVLCNFNLKYWPFDTQRCNLTFGSWTYHGYHLELNFYNDSKEVEMEYFVNNSEWIVIKNNLKISEKYYSCCQEPYPDLEVSLTFSRISSPYGVIIVTPVVVVVILTLINFWLPAQSGGKIVINATNAIIICIFLLYFSQKLPAMNYNTPLIVSFYGTCLCLVSFSMIESVIVISLSRTKHSDSVHWFIKRQLTSKFGQILRLNTSVRQSSTALKITTSEEMHDHQVTSDDGNSLQNIRRHSSSSETKSSLQEDWVLLATAIDRISFLIYCFIFLLSAIIY